MGEMLYFLFSYGLFFRRFSFIEFLHVPRAKYEDGDEWAKSWLDIYKDSIAGPYVFGENFATLKQLINNGVNQAGYDSIILREKPEYNERGERNTVYEKGQLATIKCNQYAVKAVEGEIDPFLDGRLLYVEFLGIDNDDDSYIFHNILTRSKFKCPEHEFYQIKYEETLGAADCI